MMDVFEQDWAETDSGKKENEEERESRESPESGKERRPRTRPEPRGRFLTGLTA